MNRQQKSQEVEDLKALFGDAQLMVLTEFSGLDVEQITVLRRSLRQAQAGYRVVKNTLARRALADTDLEPLTEHLTGPVAVAFSNEDPAATAKALTEFSKDNPELELKIGLMAGGKILSADDVVALGKLPGKDQLRGMLLGTFTAVPRNFLGVLQGAQRDFFGVLQARGRELEASS